MDQDEKLGSAKFATANSDVSGGAVTEGKAAASTGTDAGSVSESVKHVDGDVQSGTKDETTKVASKPAPKKATKGRKRPNNVRKIRIERMMSKAELARRANLSVLTVDRVEKGFGCRMDTKRKILEALGLSLVDRVRVFGEEE